MDEPGNKHAGAGLLVLGMHRSGTSAIARTLALCGLDIGARVSGASTGNETGHWEDAIALETHEALLHAVGAAWDQPFPLPDGWQRSSAADEARRRIGSYLAQRQVQAPWASKEPRMCLFAELWRSEAERNAVPLSALLVLRHPAEVARSLYVRDGIGVATAQLLWLEYTAMAVDQARQMPHLVVGYHDFMADWRAEIMKAAALPGLSTLGDLQPDVVERVEEFLDPALRHHVIEDDATLLPAVRDAWHAACAMRATGAVAAEQAGTIQDALRALRTQLQPVLMEARVQLRELWLRTARAEAQVAGMLSGERDPLARLELLSEALANNHADVVRMMSSTLKEGAAWAQRADARFGQLTGQVGEIGEKLVLFYSNDVRRMQDELAKFHEAHAAQVQAERKRAQDDARQAAHDNARLQDSLRRAEESHLRAQEEMHRLAAERDTRVREWEAEVDSQRRTVHAITDELRQRREDAALLAQVRASRSWRLTRPLRALRRLLTGQWSHEDSQHLRHALGFAAQRNIVEGGRVADVVTLPDPTVSVDAISLQAESPLADVFVWSVIDWHFRTQRPQHLARALASRGHRVFYISNNFVDAVEPGFSAEPIDGSGRLFQVHLHLPGAPAIYHAMPNDKQEACLRDGLAAVLGWTRTQSSISLVQHPYWRPLAFALPNARVVYDCMDHHAGFNDNATSILDSEHRLIADSDLVVVTSSWLERQVGPMTRQVSLVRNACEYDHFATPPAATFRDPQGRKVIGYYGAIADWFDPDLVRAVAQACPEALVLLVGRDTAAVGATLADLPNVRMQAEVPYAELPYWVHGFDVCLLPFRVSELTLATNPVKAYEYLAAGKPLVSVDLPELAQFEGLAEVAATRDAFVAAVQRALAQPGDARQVQARRAFAAAQTWEHRARAFDEALAGLREPSASVIVLTYNNLPFTQACLASIEAHSDYPDLEVIVVDNASGDGSVEWLQAWAKEASAAGHARRLILNDANLGFSAGNNLGLAAATGDFLIVLNNDTYVTPGWVRTLLAHFRTAPGVGLVGPVTNNIGNEARIEIHYADMTAMVEAAGRHTRAHPGGSFAMPTAAFFCVAMPRSTYEQVGGLDEQFGVGFFEDDDYCRRVEAAGLQIRCAEDVFIHHHLSASFNAIGAERKQALFEKNKALYEAKWGAWQPHAYRPPAETG